MLRPLAEDVVELIASGVDAYFATCSPNLEPETMLAMGVWVHEDRRDITIYLPRALADRSLTNLEVNPEAAVTFVRPMDHQSVQIKGRVSSVRSSDDADRDRQLLFRAALVEQFAVVGVPRELTRRLAWWPSVAVALEVRDVFVQTPGPNAGEPLRAPSVSTR